MQDGVRIPEVLAMDRQAMWTALRLSITPRFGHLMPRTALPICEPIAKVLDEASWQFLESTTGFPLA